MSEYLPNCKIICTLRDPVDRRFSLYRLMRKLGKLSTSSFQDALETSRALKGDQTYTYNLTEWIKAFVRDNVLIGLYDDLDRAPRVTSIA